MYKREIEKMKEKLDKLLSTANPDTCEALELSKELDVLIVKEQRLRLNQLSQ